MSAIPQLDLNRTIRRWDRRRRLLESIIWVPRGLLAGVLIGVVVAVISRWRAWLLQEEIMRVAIGASIVGLLAVLAVVWLSPRTILWLARHFDLRFGLKERVSTAYELQHGSIPPADDLAPYQFEDTRTIIERVNLREVLPLKPRRVEWAALLAAASLLAILLLMDNPFTQSILDKRELDQSIQDEAAALQNTRDDILGNQDLTEAQRQDLVEPLNQALETLRQPDISREEAVAALSEAEQKLQDHQNGLTADQQAAMQEAADALSGSDMTDDVSEALSESDLQQAAKDTQDLSQSIDQAQLSPQDLQQLSEQLSAASQPLQNVNPQAADAMQQAANSLQNGDTQSASQSLSQAAQSMSQQAQQSQNSPQAQAAQQAGQQTESSRQQIAQAGQQSGQQSQNSQQAAQAGQQQSGQQMAQPGQQQQSGDQGQQSAAMPSQNGEGQQGDTGVIVPGEANSGQESAVGMVPGQGDSSSQAQMSMDSAQQGDGSSMSTSQNSSNQPGQAGAGNAPGGAGSDAQQGLQQSNSQIDTQNAPGVNEGLGNFDAVFAPQHIGDTGTQDLMGVNGEPTGDQILDERQGGFNENFDAESVVPYNSVYADYANSVNENLESDYIPIGLRDVIRNYFSSLEP